MDYELDQDHSSDCWTFTFCSWATTVLIWPCVKMWAFLTVIRVFSISMDHFVILVWCWKAQGLLKDLTDHRVSQLSTETTDFLFFDTVWHRAFVQFRTESSWKVYEYFLPLHNLVKDITVPYKKSCSFNCRVTDSEPLLLICASHILCAGKYVKQ